MSREIIDSDDVVYALRDISDNLERIGDLLERNPRKELLGALEAARRTLKAARGLASERDEAWFDDECARTIDIIDRAVTLARIADAQ